MPHKSIQISCVLFIIDFPFSCEGQIKIPKDEKLMCYVCDVLTPSCVTYVLPFHHTNVRSNAPSHRNAHLINFGIWQIFGFLLVRYHFDWRSCRMFWHLIAPRCVFIQFVPYKFTRYWNFENICHRSYSFNADQWCVCVCG